MKKQAQKQQLKSPAKKQFLSVADWLLFAVAFLIYANTIFHDYALDDSMVITNNAFTKQGFSGISKLLTNDTFLGFSQEMLGDSDTKNLVQGGRYRPLSLITFAIEWQLFGKTPLVSHFINVLLFAVTCVLLYRLLNLLMQSFDNNSNEFLSVSFLASLLFALHSLHAEVIANIKGRDELLAFLFSLLAWYYAIKNIEKLSLKNYFIIGMLLFLALLSKESAIAFVAIIPLSIVMFKPEYKKQNLLLFASLFVVSIIFVLIRQAIVLPPADSSIGGLMNNPFQNASIGERIATAFYTFTKYYQLLIFPNPLTYDYYPNHILIQSFSSPLTVVGIALTILFLVVAIYYFKKNKLISFSILFFFGTFFLVSNIPVNIGAFMAERFVYMPSLAICLLVAFFANKFINQSPIKYAFIVLCVLFAGKTFSRNLDWKNNKSLFEADVKTSFNSAHVNKNLGETYLTEASKENDAMQKKLLYDKSANHLTKACGIYPDYYDAWVSLGNNYYYSAKFDKAILSYYISIKLNPEKSIRLYRAIADVYGLNLGNYKMSILYMKKALKFEKNPAQLLTNISIAFYRLKDYEQAIAYTKKVLQIEPSNNEAKTNLNVFETEYKNTQNK